MTPPRGHERLRLAFDRYGWRALVIAAYRLLFAWPRLRTNRIALMLRLRGDAHVGAHTVVGPRVSIRFRSGRLWVGERGVISHDCTIAVTAGATVEIGDCCYLAPRVTICAANRVTVGDHARIGEFSSISDTPEGASPGMGVTPATVTIGSDVWIGRGVRLVATGGPLVVGEGAVIGANAVVADDVPSYAIVAGEPATVVGYRN